MEDDLLDLLAGVAPSFWGASPQGTQRPYIVLKLRSQPRARGMTVDGLRPGVVRSRVQADCYGATPGGCAALADRLIAEVEGRRVGRFQAIFVDQVLDGSGPDALQNGVSHRRIVDLIIHHT